VRTPYFPLENDDYFLAAIEKELQTQLALIKAKRRDYGSSLGFHGVKGLMPRIADKFFRLDNLVWGDHVPQFESAIDTARDSSIYNSCAVIGLQYEQNQVQTQSNVVTTQALREGVRIWNPDRDAEP